jgi:hypothetical protein
MLALVVEKAALSKRGCRVVVVAPRG